MRSFYVLLVVSYMIQINPLFATSWNMVKHTFVGLAMPQNRYILKSVCRLNGQ